MHRVLISIMNNKNYLSHGQCNDGDYDHGQCHVANRLFENPHNVMIRHCHRYLKEKEKSQNINLREQIQQSKR